MRPRHPTWLLLPLFLLPGSPLEAGELADATYMAQAIGRVMGTVREIDDRFDYGYDGPGTVCLMAGLFRPGAVISMEREMRAGVRYAVLGGGDDDAEDIDIGIFDAAGRLLAKDVRVDAMPLVEFTPARTDRYEIRLRLDSAGVDCYCALAVMRDGGYDVPVDSVLASVGRLFEHGQHVAGRVGRASFLGSSDQWCLWGSIYRPEQYTVLRNVSLGTGGRVLIAAGDTHAIDIDARLLDRFGRVVAEDILPDADPRVAFDAFGSEAHQVVVHNVESRDETLIISAVLAVE